MRCSVLALLALCLVLALALQPAVCDDASTHDEAVDTNDEPRLPPLTEDEFAHVMTKVSSKCVKQVQENPSDPTQVSDRCRNEVATKIQRFLARKASGESDDVASKKRDAKPKKATKPKKKKLTRAQREAAAALKKDEEYQKTVQTIVGFVVTFIAGVSGVIFFINRKLKSAGMYYPTDPAAKATGGCC